MQEPVPDLLKCRADLLLAQKIKEADPPTVRSQRGGRLQSVQVHANLKHDHNPFYLHARAHTGRADPREAMPCHAMPCCAMPCHAMRCSGAMKLPAERRWPSGRGLATRLALTHLVILQPAEGCSRRAWPSTAPALAPAAMIAVRASHLMAKRALALHTVSQLHGLPGRGRWRSGSRSSTNRPCIDCRYSPCLPCSLDRAASAHAMESNM